VRVLAGFSPSPSKGEDGVRVETDSFFQTKTLLS
jgi:hypothetical protein